jgi:hypothetical protein
MEDPKLERGIFWLDYDEALVDGHWRLGKGEGANSGTRSHKD